MALYGTEEYQALATQTILVSSYSKSATSHCYFFVFSWDLVVNKKNTEYHQIYALKILFCSGVSLLNTMINKRLKDQDKQELIVPFLTLSRSV